MLKKFSRDKHIENIVKEFDFNIRSGFHASACFCYKINKPCHKMKNLNCFLCYCPNYDSGKMEGGCKRKSPKGKWFYSKKLPKGKIWDCSGCTYPHHRKTVKKYLSEIL